jgi:hypothetical protein
LYVVARLRDLGSFRLWFDEIFSVQVVERGWADLVRFVATYDPHPPLWYLLLKLWTAIAGPSYLSLGLFALLPALAMLVPFFLIVGELRLPARAANLALLMVAVNGYLIGSAQELRMYSLLATLALCSMWLLVKRCNDDGDRVQDWVVLTLVNVLLVSTQYYGWLAVGAEGLFLLFWNPRKWLWLVASTTLVVVAELPWLWYLMSNAASRVSAHQEAIAFTSRPTVYSVAWFYEILAGAMTFPRNTTIALFVFCAPVVWWAWSRLRSRAARSSSETGVLAALAVFSIAPVLVAVLASLVLPFSIWGQRHLIIVAIPYLLLVTAAVDRLRSRLLRTAWIVAIVAWAAVAGVGAVNMPYKVPAWDGLIARLLESPSDQQITPIYALNSSAAYVVHFYLDKTGDRRFTSVAIRREVESASNTNVGSAPKPYWQLVVPVASVSALTDLPADHFWVADDGGDDGESASAWDGKGSVRSIFARSGYRVGEGFSATVVVRRWSSRRVELFPVWRSGAGSPAQVASQVLPSR